MAEVIAARKGVEYDAAPLGAVQYRVGDQRDGLYGWMQGELGVTVPAEAIDPGIGPDIRTIAAVPAELDVVYVGRGADFEDEHQLVL